MKEIVKYHNDMNKISFSGYTEKELNLFFSIVFLVKEKQSETIEIPFSQLKKIANGDTHSDRFVSALESVNKKLIRMAHEIKIGDDKHIFSLFNVFTTNIVTKTLTVKINEIFSYMLNDLIGNFTKFDLLEFVELKSSYSKNLYKLLKQWDSLGKKEFTIEEYRNVLNIPEKYRMSEIDKFVNTPIMIELPQYFFELKLEKIKSGRNIAKLKFTWSRKKEVKQEIVEVVFSEELHKAFEYASKNRYIKPFMTLENKNELTNQFEEEALIRALRYAKDEIKKEFKYLSYLVKCIEKYLKKAILKEKKDIKKKTVNKTDHSNMPDEQFKKKKITQENFDIMLQEKLKGIDKKILERSPFLVETNTNILLSEYEIIEELKVVEDKGEQKGDLEKEFEEFLKWKEEMKKS